MLDHCARERAAAGAGVKAVFLYPMNALATDQAQRINGLLVGEPALRRLQAGLYIGDRAATRYEKVCTNRSDMRVSPPDILITNYKMLDLLLQRSADRPLWTDADIRYVVVDEFHTYDGAQGTDVAMLLRRLAAAVGTPGAGPAAGRDLPGRDLGDPRVGHRARRAGALLEVAGAGLRHTVPRRRGDRGGRQTVEEFLPPTGWSPTLPMPSPDQLAALPDPADGAEALADLVEARHRRARLDPFVLGRDPADTPADRGGADGARRAGPHEPRGPGGAVALGRAVAGRGRSRSSPRSPRRPWPASWRCCRSRASGQSAGAHGRSCTSRCTSGRGRCPGWCAACCRGRARSSAGTPRATGRASTPATRRVTAATAAQDANLFLPAVYCRDCGRSGWAVFSPESDDQALQLDTHRIRRASTSQDKVRVRNLDRGDRPGGPRGLRSRADAARPARAAPARRRAGGTLMVLDGPAARLRLPDPQADYDPDTGEPRLATRDSAFVLVTLGATGNTAAGEDWCPACGERNAIRYPRHRRGRAGRGVVTQLFTGGELDEQQREKQDVDVQRLGAGRRAPGRVRGQPVVHVLAARAAHQAPGGRGSRPR